MISSLAFNISLKILVFPAYIWRVFSGLQNILCYCWVFFIFFWLLIHLVLTVIVFGYSLMWKRSLMKLDSFWFDHIFFKFQLWQLGENKYNYKPILRISTWFFHLYIIQHFFFNKILHFSLINVEIFSNPKLFLYQMLLLFIWSFCAQSVFTVISKTWQK